MSPPRCEAPRLRSGLPGAVSRMLDAGVPIAKVAKIVGWSPGHPDHRASLGFGSAYGTLDVPVAITVGSRPERRRQRRPHSSTIAAANFSGGVSILLGNGNATFQSRSSSTSEGRFVTSGNFNGDDIPDLVVASTITGNTVSVFLGKGGVE